MQTQDNRTLHASQQGFWATTPQPLAELGSNLIPSSPAYLEDVLRLSWALLLLATHVELARHRREGGAPVDARRAAAALQQASPGKIVRFLQELAPRGEAWGWNESDQRFAPLAAMLKRPRMDAQQAVESIAQLRNAWAHHDALPASREECASALEQTVRALLSSHATLSGARLIYTHRVERRGNEEWYAGIALEGPTPTPFRRGEWQPGWAGIPQGRVYLQQRATTGLLDLHPYVWFDGQRCLLLSELKLRSRGVSGEWWWARESNVTPGVNADLQRAIAEALPLAIDDPEVPTYVDPLGSRAEAWAEDGQGHVAHPQPLNESKTRSPALLFGALAAAAMLVGVCAVGGAVVAWSVARPSSDGSVLPAMGAAAGSTRCSSPTTSAAPHDLPRWLTGLDVRWGESPTAFDERCGARPPDPHLAGCAIAAGRDLGPTVASGIPLVHEAGAAFDVRSGMFEITLRSRASPAEIASIVTSRYGEPRSARGLQFVWFFDDLRVSLAGPPGGGPGAVLVARYRPLSDLYYRDRPRLCPR